MEDMIREAIGFTGAIRFNPHHLCHVAGAYYCSGFDAALLASFDGLGESETSIIGLGKDRDLKTARFVVANPLHHRKPH